MGSIVVDVMLKPEILDPQGQAVAGALPRLGFASFSDVRQGKRFVLTVDGKVTDEHLAEAREAAEKLLSNPVIEDVVSVRALDGADEQAAADADQGGKAARKAANTKQDTAVRTAAHETGEADA
jgi:phosphoribosylformylglycinamidine synthase